MIHSGHEPMVKGGIGQHHTQTVLPRRQRRGQQTPPGALQDHDGGGRRLQQGLLLRTEPRIVPHHPRIPGHERERFVVATLAPTQPRNGRAIGGIAGQMKVSDTLHCNDMAITDQITGRGDGIPTRSRSQFYAFAPLQP